MPPKLVLLACIAGILWLFWRERKSRESLSAALWLPVIWAFLIGSRPVSAWLNAGSDIHRRVDNLEGSPLDRLVFFALIAAGLLVLAQRRESWSRIVWNNKWVFGFYLYLGLSVLWSDYSFVSFKRWIKDFGNIVMALVVLSELNLADAFKSVLRSFAYLLIPLSVVAAKYLPDIGRYYDPWTYRMRISGIADDKNLLGMSLFVCGLFLFDWFLDSRKASAAVDRKHSGAILLGLSLLTLWLLVKAQSVSAMVCTVIGVTALYVLRRFGAKRMVVCGALMVVLALFLSSAFNMTGFIGTLLGRDTTLTGRTEIWSILLKEPVNPLVGVGFSSFWLGDRVEKILEKYDRTLNEAHNGYLEAYLNSGLIGLSLLIGLIVSSIRAQWRNLQAGVAGTAFRLSFLLGTVIYNFTEAPFNRQSIIWFTFLLVVVVYPRPREEFEVQDAAGCIPAADAPGRAVLTS